MRAAGGERPSTITYTSLIAAYARDGYWQGACMVLRAMREDGARPNTRTYTALISACERAGQWEKAKELFQEMKEEGEKDPKGLESRVTQLTNERARKTNENKRSVLGF